jgi:hypothetical protein
VIWVAYNGWLGEGPVAAVVEADTEQEARVMAAAALKKAAEDGSYDETYWNIEEISVLELPYVGDSL